MIALLSLSGVLGQNSGRYHCTFVPFGCFWTKLRTPRLHFCPFRAFWDKTPDACTSQQKVDTISNQSTQNSKNIHDTV